MAKRKKKSDWPYKFVTVDKMQELDGLDNAALLKEALRYDTNARAEAKNKKSSEALKELRGIINEHRKNYEDVSEDFEKAKKALEDEKTFRDAEIVDQISDKKDLEKGYNEATKNFTEHRDACLKLLKNRK